MKMKKLLSIGALTLAIATCTTIGASAADVAGRDNKRQAMQSIVTKGLDGGRVFNDIPISAQTEVGDYLTDAFINETNEFLENNKLNVYFDEAENKEVSWKIEKDDNLYVVQKNIVKTLRTLNKEEKDEAVYYIKKYLLSKLEQFENASSESNAKLVETINKYFKTTKYGTLTVGINRDNAKTVTLVKSGKIVAQVNTNNVYKVADKLNSIKNYDDLKNLILEYYPDAEDYLNNIK
jgi:hypothetical protein